MAGALKVMLGGDLNKTLSYTLSPILALSLALSLVPLLLVGNLNSLAEAKDTSADDDLPAYVENEVIVKYAEKTSDVASLACESENDVALLSADESEQLTSDTKVYKLQDGISVEEAVKTLNDDPRVLYAEPNSYAYLAEADEAFLCDFFVNDPLAESMQWALTDENAPMKDVWEKTKTNHKVGVAVLDSGVYSEHPDLKNNLKEAVSIVGEDKDWASDYQKSGDIEGHGTHVCGIVSAEANNEICVAGMSYNADILSVRIFYRTSSKPTSTSAEIVKGIEYALSKKDEMNIRVINMSLSFKDVSTGTQAVTDAIDAAWDAGVLCCVASGNNSTSASLQPTGFPANYEKSLAVGSIDSKHARSSFSNGDENLDVVAPGSEICSTNWVGSYAMKSGTSMATPYVSAVAALMWANNSSLTPLQVSNALKKTATDLGDTGKDDAFGYGQVNPLAALLATDAEDPEPDPDPEPEVTEVEVHRLYNTWTGEHFYTTSSEETSTLVKAGWTDEGVGWKAPETGNVPVYRLYNKFAGDHFFTADEQEYADLKKAGWTQEGVAFLSSEDEGAVKILRAYNPNAESGSHNFTVDSDEQQTILKAGWKDEGVGFYAQP